MSDFTAVLHAQLGSTSSDTGSLGWDAVVLAAATVALVVITAYYARQTRNLVATTNALVVQTQGLVTEAQAARRPLLIATLHLLVPGLAELRLVNAGASAAVNIVLKFWPLPSGVVRDWSWPLLEAADSVNFRLLPGPTVRLPEFLKDYRAVHFKGAYQDVSGAGYEIDQEVPVLKLWEFVGTAEQLAAARRYEDRHIEALEKIAKELGDTHRAAPR